MKASKRFRMFLSLFGAALLTVMLSAAIPTPTYAEPTVSPARIQNAQVVDTYYHYACPRGDRSHDMDYNYTYKLLTFQNGYKRSSRRTLNQWSANLCGCGSGTVYIYQNIYMIY